MLSKKDLDQIRLIFSEEIIKALTIKTKYEKNKDEKTGLKLAVPEIIERDEYLPAWWIQYLPHYEASNRGIQRTQDKQATQLKLLKNEIIDLKDGMKLIGNIMLQTEQSLKCIAAISDKANQIKQEDIIKIGGK